MIVCAGQLCPSQLSHSCEHTYLPLHKLIPVVVGEGSEETRGQSLGLSDHMNNPGQQHNTKSPTHKMLFSQSFLKSPPTDNKHFTPFYQQRWTNCFICTGLGAIWQIQSQLEENYLSAANFKFYLWYTFCTSWQKKAPVCNTGVCEDWLLDYHQ